MQKYCRKGRDQGQRGWSSLDQSKMPRQREQSPGGTWIVWINEKGTYKWGCILQCKFPAPEDQSSVHVPADSWWMQLESVFLS